MDGALDILRFHIQRHFKTSSIYASEDGFCLSEQCRRVQQFISYNNVLNISMFHFYAFIGPHKDFSVKL